mgnify:FL=1
MNSFTNINIKNQYKKTIIYFVISIILIILSIVFYAWKCSIIKTSRVQEKSLNDIIINEKTEKDYKSAYINNVSNPVKFAIDKENNNAYYIVNDGKYLYVIYMNEEKYQSIIQNKSEVKIEGITKYPTKDVKELAIEKFNDDKDENDKISLVDYDNYFGDVYLDMEESESSIAIFQIFLIVITIIPGIIIFIINLVKIINFNKIKSKYSIKELDNEMNDKNSFYYDKANLYLTPNYIINFSGKLFIIKYTDIDWIYPNITKTNGIKTAKSIILITKENKTYIISNLSNITRKSKEIYDEIWDTIVSKNSDMLVGYTEENIKAYKDKKRK